MITLEEMKDACHKQMPVVVHNPDNPQAFCAGKIGLIVKVIPESENPESRQRQTYNEPCAIIIFDNDEESFKWAHEFRIAKLRNPYVPKRLVFDHTHSSRYCASDEPF